MTSGLVPEVEEALRRGAVVWIGVDDEPPRPAWHLWHDDAVLVVTGPGEQALPGLAAADEARVVVRGPHALAGAVAELVCDVERLPPGTPEWQRVAPLLAEERLNAVDQAGLVGRWVADGVVVLRLRPR
jgi:hypothetical protein